MTYPLRRSQHLLRAWLVLVVVVAVGHAILTGYFLKQQVWSLAGLVAGLWVLVTLLLGYARHMGLREPLLEHDCLQWHNGVWMLLCKSEAHPPCEVVLVRPVADWQTGMLLRMKRATNGRALWVCVQAQWAPLNWGDLRRAVHHGV